MEVAEREGRPDGSLLVSFISTEILKGAATASADRLFKLDKNALDAQRNVS